MSELDKILHRALQYAGVSPLASDTIREAIALIDREGTVTGEQLADAVADAYERGRAAGRSHKHDPDTCDLCIEMVEESWRD